MEAIEVDVRGRALDGRYLTRWAPDLHVVSSDQVRRVSAIRTFDPT